MGEIAGLCSVITGQLGLKAEVRSNYGGGR